MWLIEIVLKRGSVELSAVLINNFDECLIVETVGGQHMRINREDIKELNYLEEVLW
jgi:hypothetical protein